MTAEALGIREALHADVHQVLPRLAYVADGARKDFGDHPAAGMAAVGVGAAVTGLYSASALVETVLVGTGAYFGHKYGWVAGGSAEAGLSAALEVGMGAMTYLGIKRMPNLIGNYADVKYKDDKRIKSRTLGAGRYAGIAFAFGTPGIMIDSVIREPVRTPAAHARNGAIAAGGLIALNFGIGSGVTKAIEGATSSWTKHTWHDAADWLRAHGAGSINTGISTASRATVHAAEYVGDHLPAVGGGAAVLLGCYALYRTAKAGWRFKHTRQAVKARLRRDKSTPDT